MTMSGAVRQEEMNFSADGGHIVQTPRTQPFKFVGSGSEYFRIWIVNLLLTIVTLGIYSAWAKVRRNQYFYDSTQVDGTSFEYHGNPIAILKGRVIAFVCLVSYNLSFKHSPTLGLSVLAVLALVMPWLVWKSLQFKLYNSSYRGIRFGFRGSLGRVYWYFLVLPILCILPLYTLVPLAHQQAKKFQHNESRFGESHFSFVGKISSFYKIYLLGLVAAIVGIVAIVSMVGVAAFSLFANKGQPVDPAQLKAFGFGIMSIYALLFCLIPLFFTMMQNLIWNNTRLGEHQFTCKLTIGKTIFIMLTNLLGTIVTLGLFIPFAHIRMLKYRIESLTLIPHEDLDHFVAHEQEQTSATGEGMTDLFDFDISL